MEVVSEMAEDAAEAEAAAAATAVAATAVAAEAAAAGFLVELFFFLVTVFSLRRFSIRALRLLVSIIIIKETDFFCSAASFSFRQQISFFSFTFSCSLA